MVGTTAAATASAQVPAGSAQAPAGSGTGVFDGRRVSEERGERSGEGSDAGAEQGVQPAKDDPAVGAGRHQTFQIRHAPVGHHVHSAPELVARSF